MKDQQEYRSLVLLAAIFLIHAVVAEIIVVEFDGESGIPRAYDVGEKLGSGGDGEVYEAYLIKRRGLEDGVWERTGEKVAVKKVKASDKGAALNECEASKTLHDYTATRVNGLVYIHGHAEIKNGIWPEHSLLVMDFVDGLALSKYRNICHVKKTQSETHERIIVALKLIINLLSIFEHVHRKEISHDDLHTRNIMVKKSDKDGRPTDFTLIDFGCATVRGKQPLGNPKTPKDDLLELMELFCNTCKNGLAVVSSDGGTTYSIINAYEDAFYGEQLRAALTYMLPAFNNPRKGGPSYGNYIQPFSRILSEVEQEAELVAKGEESSGWICVIA